MKFILNFNSKRGPGFRGFTMVEENRTGKGSKYAIKYNLNELVYYEESFDINSAIEREKQLKNWHKDWKWNLIKKQNIDLIDLSIDWYDREILN